ncbi:MAG: hypothetical protein ABIF77_10560 [bacterium]
MQDGPADKDRAGPRLQPGIPLTVLVNGLILLLAISALLLPHRTRPWAEATLLVLDPLGPTRATASFAALIDWLTEVEGRSWKLRVETSVHALESVGGEVVARFTGHPVRVIENELAKKIKELEEKNPFPEEVKADRFAGSKVAAGNIEKTPLLCGLCAGDIREIKSCQEIIEEIVKELEK